MPIQDQEKHQCCLELKLAQDRNIAGKLGSKKGSLVHSPLSVDEGTRNLYRIENELRDKANGGADHGFLNQQACKYQGGDLLVVYIGYNGREQYGRNNHR